MKPSLCETCVFGQCVSGKVLHRHTVIGGSESDDYSNEDSDLDDYLDDDEESPVSPGASLKINEQYLSTQTTICFFPHEPGPKLPPNFESYVFNDTITEKCSRYIKMDV